MALDIEQLLPVKPTDFPGYPEIADALLALLLLRGEEGALRSRDCYAPLADAFGLSEEQRARRRSDRRGGSAWENCVQWSRQLLINEGKLDGRIFGIWKITDAGRMQAIRSPFARRIAAALGECPFPADTSIAEEYYVDWDRYSIPERWRLIEWCFSCGADEFTITAHPDLRGALQEEVVWHAAFSFWEAIEEFRRPSADREAFAHVEEALLDVEPRSLWSLTPESLIAMRAHIPDAMSTHSRTDPENGHFEDPVFYRAGTLMLGVSADHGWGILRVTQGERAMLERLMFTIHDDWGA